MGGTLARIDGEEVSNNITAAAPSLQSAAEQDGGLEGDSPPLGRAWGST